MLTMLTFNVDDVNIYDAFVKTACYNTEMKAIKTSPYHHGNLKEALVDTAMEMIDTDGLDAITLRDITQRLGTSRSAVYRHFENKEALILGVITRGYEQLDLLFTPIFQDQTRSVSERFRPWGEPIWILLSPIPTFIVFCLARCIARRERSFVTTRTKAKLPDCTR